ncbi:Na+/H+ antiporter subunit E [Spirochaetota bacterium]
MEVTLLIEAMDTSFNLIEDAKKQAVELLDSAVRLTSETRTIEEKKVHALVKGAQQRSSRVTKFISTFFFLFGFWLILSGKFDIFHITLGVICSAIVASYTHNLLFHNVRIGDFRLILIRLVTYIPWLIYQIALSNFHVMRLVLSPKMPIEPQIIKFTTKLESDVSWVTLANSITLTPGTITIDIKDREFYVHALSKKVADDLLSGEMEDKVAHVYMEADHIYVQDVLDVAPIFGKLRKGVF